VRERVLVVGRRGGGSGRVPMSTREGSGDSVSCLMESKL
jgi:hypothetical protein